jgi:hypothetical protein
VPTIVAAAGYCASPQYSTMDPPVVKAAAANNVAKLVQLLEEGADVNLSSITGTTGLMKAPPHCLAPAWENPWSEPLESHLLVPPPAPRRRPMRGTWRPSRASWTTAPGPISRPPAPAPSPPKALDARCLLEDETYRTTALMLACAGGHNQVVVQLLSRVPLPGQYTWRRLEALAPAGAEIKDYEAPVGRAIGTIENQNL